jgi:hypothetical protein
MYVQFDLPQGRMGPTILEAIKASIALWVNKYEIPYNGYSQKTIKYTHRLGFNCDEYFSLFSMTYTDFEFRIVNVQNEKY